MRVLILAGGKGERLRPLTLYCPKVLLSVHGKAFLEYILQKLKGHSIVLSVCYLGNVIKRYCRLHCHSVEFVEDKEWSTGGSIWAAQEFFKGYKKLLVLNGDSIIDIVYEELFNEHETSKYDATVLYAQDYINKQLAPAGVFVLSQSMFKILNGTNEKLESALKRARVKKVYSEKPYLDIGNFESLRFAKENTVVCK